MSVQPFRGNRLPGRLRRRRCRRDPRSRCRKVRDVHRCTSARMGSRRRRNNPRSEAPDTSRECRWRSPPSSNAPKGIRRPNSTCSRTHRSLPDRPAPRSPGTGRSPHNRRQCKSLRTRGHTLALRHRTRRSSPGSPPHRHRRSAQTPRNNPRSGSHIRPRRGKRNDNRDEHRIPPGWSRQRTVRTPTQGTRPRTIRCPPCTRDTTSARRDTELPRQVLRRRQLRRCLQRGPRCSSGRFRLSGQLPRSTAPSRLAASRYPPQRCWLPRSRPRGAGNPGRCTRLPPRPGSRPQPKRAGTSSPAQCRSAEKWTTLFCNVPDLQK
jgi:hypothetical protein